ncbi:MAG: elongation factor P maturation arginine rhamnosyltransferase EarP, partial [Burkholderiaceae bacterium]
MTRRLRLLCRVVDNFGDAGVCWRLARQLATEHGWHVRLLIDRPELLERLSPDTPAGTGGPVDVERWPADGPDAADDIASDDIASDDIAGDDILISAFGAEPPAALRRRLAGAPRRPLWVNLEYLSAEDWVDDCHGLSSL